MKNSHIFLLLIIVLTILFVKGDLKKTFENSSKKISIIPFNVELHINKLKKYKHYNPEVFNRALKMFHHYYVNKQQDILYFTTALSILEELSFSMEVEESFQYQELLDQMSCLNDKVKYVFPIDIINHNYIG